MTPERFARIVAAYGARPEHWPAGERAAALALIGRDPACAALLAEEEALDTMLDGYRVPLPHGALVGSVLNGAPRERSRPRWRIGLGLAGSALAGMVAGVAAMAVAAPALLDRAGQNWDEGQPTAFSTPPFDDEASL